MHTWYKRYLIDNCECPEELLEDKNSVTQEEERCPATISLGNKDYTWQCLPTAVKGSKRWLWLLKTSIIKTDINKWNMFKVFQACFIRMLQAGAASRYKWTPCFQVYFTLNVSYKQTFIFSPMCEHFTWQTPAIHILCLNWKVCHLVLVKCFCCPEAVRL